MFLGTPHRGSEHASLGLIAYRVARAAGFDANDRMLRTLQQESDVLELLREEFSKRLAAKSFDVYTFQEGLGLSGVRGLSDKV